MGLEVFVAKTGGAIALDALLEKLAAQGFATAVMMIDNQLRMPGAPSPADWKDARLRTPAGVVTLSRRADGIAVLVFGNADAALQSAQERIAAALRES